MAKEVEKYSDGTVIVRFPKWVYPGGEVGKTGPSNTHNHNGVLVNDQKELDALIKADERFECYKESSNKKAAGWDK